MKKFEDLLRTVSDYAPDYVVTEQADGNIILNLNRRLDTDRCCLTGWEDLTEGEDS